MTFAIGADAREESASSGAVGDQVGEHHTADDDNRKVRIPRWGSSFTTMVRTTGTAGGGIGSCAQQQWPRLLVAER